MQTGNPNTKISKSETWKITMEVRSETIISWSCITSSGERSFHVCKIADSELCSATSYQDTCPLLVFTWLNLTCCYIRNSGQFGNVRQLTKEPSAFGTGVPSQSLKHSGQPEIEFSVPKMDGIKTKAGTWSSGNIMSTGNFQFRQHCLSLKEIYLCLSLQKDCHNSALPLG